MKIFKKILKWIGLAVVAVVGYFLLVFYFEMSGNPVTKFKMKNSAKNYLEQYYPDCYIYDSGYNFKTEEYLARIKSLSSVDTDFYLYADKNGKIISDTYSRDVASGDNTRIRIGKEYNELVKAVFAQDKTDSGKHLLVANYPQVFNRNFNETENLIYGMPDDEAVPDKVYNHQEISYKYGEIYLSVRNEDVSAEQACRILLEVKEKLAENNLGFYCVDFSISEPPNSDGTLKENSKAIIIDDFMYSDIYEEGLEERIKAVMITENF